MSVNAKKLKKPAISISRTDHDRLSKLAGSHSGSNADVANELLRELDRARIVSDAGISSRKAVRMGSRLRYATDAGQEREIVLTYPGQADIEAGRVSILTPIGVALIGLSSGQSIDWIAPNGRVNSLYVIEVIEADEPALP